MAIHDTWPTEKAIFKKVSIGPEIKLHCKCICIPLLKRVRLSYEHQGPITPAFKICLCDSVMRSQVVSWDTLLFTLCSNMHLKCVSCDHLWLEGRVSDFETTYIAHNISVLLQVYKLQKAQKVHILASKYIFIQKQCSATAKYITFTCILLQQWCFKGG